jgi:hypothetical protein
MESYRHVFLLVVHWLFAEHLESGFWFSQVASHTDYESTQTGELEPSNPDILCREP